MAKTKETPKKKYKNRVKELQDAKATIASHEKTIESLRVQRDNVNGLVDVLFSLLEDRIRDVVRDELSDADFVLR